MRRLRILQVVGGLGIGGTETWLLHLARALDRDRFALDLVVHQTAEGAYEADIARAGARVLRCLGPRRPWAYARSLLGLLRREGPYQVVHSHLHHFSGLVLAVARRAGVPVRIAHSHTDSRGSEAGAGMVRRAYLAAMRAAILHSATHRVATSGLAAADLFGAQWASASVVPCGLDLAPFGAPVDVASVRRELGLPPGALVVGHVGRFVPEKNHALAVRVIAEMARREPRVHALFVGEGPERAAVEQQVAAAQLGARVVFAGARRDVPRLLPAMDVLLFPSLREGLGLAAVEAQAAGLPVIVSDAVPDEARHTDSLSRLPLSAPVSLWAARTLAAARAPRRAPPSTLGWPCDLRTSLAAIERLYSSAAGGA